MVLSTRPDPIALWVVPVSDLAGVARHVLDVARAGIPGYRLLVLCPPGDLPRELRSLGAAVIEAPFGPVHGLKSSLASLRHALRTVRPAVAHSHLSYADIALAMVAPLRGGPSLVTTEHGIAHDDLVYHRSASKARLMAAAHTARLRRFDAAIAVSDATAHAMRHKWRPRRAIRVIHNGVDPVPSNPSTGLRVLSLARLAPEKRLPELVRGFAQLASHEPAAHLTLAGIGPLEGDLRSLVSHLGLESQVTMPGFVEPEKAMAEHDVLAMLSWWENCSYALLDAAVRGMGVVASPVGGNPEILPKRCLVDPADTGAVSLALHSQATNPASRPLLDDWPTVKDMTDEIAEVYARLVGVR